MVIIASVGFGNSDRGVPVPAPPDSTCPQGQGKLLATPHRKVVKCIKIIKETSCEISGVTLVYRALLRVTRLPYRIA